MDFDKTPGRTLPGVRKDSDDPHKRWPYITLLVGALPGRMYRFREPVTTLGRSMDCDVSFSDLGVSRVHARLERIADDGVELVDLESTNGSFVNGEEARRRVLNDGDKIQLGPTVVLRFNLQDAVDEAFQRSQFEAMTRDGLTGCFNRLYFDEELRRELSFARRGGAPLSVAMLDLDHFKKINDTWGHQAGDQVLVEVARKLRIMLREYDMLARVGGEEFALLMRATDIDVAKAVTERLRLGIEQLRIPINDGRDISVTGSLGVASVSEFPNAGPDEIIRTADMRLYEAKRRGRNRVVCEGHLSGAYEQRTRPITGDAAHAAVRRAAVARTMDGGTAKETHVTTRDTVVSQLRADMQVTDEKPREG